LREQNEKRGMQTLFQVGVIQNIGERSDAHNQPEGITEQAHVQAGLEHGTIQGVDIGLIKEFSVENVEECVRKGPLKLPSSFPRDINGQWTGISRKHIESSKSKW